MVLSQQRMVNQNQTGLIIINQPINQKETGFLYILGNTKERHQTHFEAPYIQKQKCHFILYGPKSCSRYRKLICFNLGCFAANATWSASFSHLAED